MKTIILRSTKKSFYTRHLHSFCFLTKTNLTNYTNTNVIKTFNFYTHILNVHNVRKIRNGSHFVQRNIIIILTGEGAHEFFQEFINFLGKKDWGVLGGIFAGGLIIVGALLWKFGGPGQPESPNQPEDKKTSSSGAATAALVPPPRSLLTRMFSWLGSSLKSFATVDNESNIQPKLEEQQPMNESNIQPRLEEQQPMNESNIQPRLEEQQPMNNSPQNIADTAEQKIPIPVLTEEQKIPIPVLTEEQKIDGIRYNITNLLDEIIIVVDDIRFKENINRLENARRDFVEKILDIDLKLLDLKSQKLNIEFNMSFFISDIFVNKEKEASLLVSIKDLEKNRQNISNSLNMCEEEIESFWRKKKNSISLEKIEEIEFLLTTLQEKQKSLENNTYFKILTEEYIKSYEEELNLVKAKILEIEDGTNNMKLQISSEINKIKTIEQNVKLNHQNFLNDVTVTMNLTDKLLENAIKLISPRFHWEGTTMILNPEVIAEKIKVEQIVRKKNYYKGPYVGEFSVIKLTPGSEEYNKKILEKNQFLLMRLFDYYEENDPRFIEKFKSYCDKRGYLETIILPDKIAEHVRTLNTIMFNYDEEAIHDCENYSISTAAFCHSNNTLPVIELYQKINIPKYPNILEAEKQHYQKGPLSSYLKLNNI